MRLAPLELAGNLGQQTVGVLSTQLVRSSIQPLLDRLRAFYGALPVPPSQPFALYVWEVLSVNTTPARRDAAFNALHRLRALTPDSLSRVPQPKLEAAVAYAGAMKDERLRALRAGADVFRRNPDLARELTGPMGRVLRAARRLPHLGRASAVRFLLFTAGCPVVPLDSDALRVARRLGFGGGPAERLAPPLRVVRDVRRELSGQIGGELAAARETSLYFTHHGLTTCTEAAPHCRVCPVAPDCEWLRLQPRCLDVNSQSPTPNSQGDCT